MNKESHVPNTYTSIKTQYVVLFKLNMPNIVCELPECNNQLPKGQRKYCSKQCKWNRDKRVQRAKEIGKEYKIQQKDINKPMTGSKDQTGRTSPRRGPLYEKFVELGYAKDLAEERIEQSEVAEDMKCTIAHVSRMFAAYKEDIQRAKEQEDWAVPKEAKASLKSFTKFRERYFLTEKGKPFETAPFHENWINNILDAIDKGGQLQILSPPRHGKTELLIHFCIWEICKNPNIRIMWVGGNEDIAKNSVASVLDQLETNEKLVQDFCGPGGSFKPATRTGKSWSQTGFTVATRTVSGIKSPTMVGIGRGGKILSRDCDLIIADDIEDHSSTVQPSAREHTKNWWTTTLGSRKEEHTAIVVIGSRQHPEDLYSSLLDNQAWYNIVEEAHDSSCTLSTDNVEEHYECMLWSGFRTFKWLESRRQDSMTTGGLSRFEMVYLNKAIAGGLQIFDPEAIEQCKQTNVIMQRVPKGSYLVAGLDPAATGYQAAVLWAVNFDPFGMQLVDIDNQHGGGIDQALRVIQEWNELYDLYHWVIEENNFQKAIRQDKRIKEFCNTRGIILEGHETYKNKWDPAFGVTAMANLFTDRNIILPYGNPESQIKVDQYKKQLIYFASKGQNKSKYISDIVMASWFPMKVIRRLSKSSYANMEYDYEPSYSNFAETDWNEAPWS